MKIQLVCALVGLLCGEPMHAQSQGDDSFAPRDNRPCSEQGTMGMNGWQYKSVDASPGRCKWVEDEEGTRAIFEIERHRQELFWALRSRPLTDAEMAEVAQSGAFLNIPMGVPYSAEEKARELNDALFQQYRMRACTKGCAP